MVGSESVSNAPTEADRSSANILGAHSTWITGEEMAAIS